MNQYKININKDKFLKLRVDDLNSTCHHYDHHAFDNCHHKMFIIMFMPLLRPTTYSSISSNGYRKQPSMGSMSPLPPQCSKRFLNGDLQPDKLISGGFGLGCGRTSLATRLGVMESNTFGSDRWQLSCSS
ncbi:Uncharacterized protein TCM_006610 [Theobroma cacao]|uniref:Uncharacterized protein n=1 Tax=Theobroma cacao TaxID=3641 RepID=A0A061DY14_THECC|nr:Uncharacterized protein TCM_006610 [Theobroma cacao]